MFVEQFGVAKVVLFLITFFKLAEIYQSLYKQLDIKERSEKFIEMGQSIKERIEMNAAGKPIVDQIDLAAKTINDISVETKRLIVRDWRLFN